MSSIQVPFCNLKAQYQHYKKEIDSAVQNVIDNCSFVLGPQVTELEENLEKFIDIKHAVTCNSGTDALILAMMALDIGPGDEVITTPFTFYATAETILYRGATPIFVDVEEDTFNINVDEIEKKITSKTKAIMPVSLYGQCSDMDKINEIANKHGIAVIEDAAQSFGATYKNKRSGNLSTIGCTSFFPAKPLGTYGDGGAVFTNNSKLAEKMAILRNHGQVARYTHGYVGINSRLDSIQASVLSVKLKYYEDEIKKRQAVAKRYDEGLRPKGYKTPFIKNDRDSVFAQYTIIVDNREELQKSLQSKGIPSAVHYPIPLFAQKALAHLEIDQSSFPISNMLSEKVMSLPMCGFLTEDHQKYIIENM